MSMVIPCVVVGHYFVEIIRGSCEGSSPWTLRRLQKKEEDNIGTHAHIYK